MKEFFENRIKPRLCHDNFTGNIFYWAWKDLECTCCAFWRGVLVGAILSNVIWIPVWMLLA